MQQSIKFDKVDFTIYEDDSCDVESRSKRMTFSISPKGIRSTKTADSTKAQCISETQTQLRLLKHFFCI